MKDRHYAATILIADDDVAFLEALRLRLDAEGFKVVVARDGYSALDRATHQRPDLLILDVNMPAGNGFSVQSRMAKQPELASTPVIYLTGSTADGLERSAGALGAHAVIHKPFQTEELLATVYDALAHVAEPLSS
jgi:CheY-like chemotaxis protein